jgi:hypothetical protein
MTVLLTPDKNTRVWYKIDKEKFALYLYSTSKTSISYRLTAPRFDYEKWTNRNDNGPRGFIINDPDQPSLITLNNFGNVSSDQIQVISSQNYSPAQNQSFENIASNLESVIYTINNLSEDLIDVFAAYKQLIAEKIQTGLITSQNLIVKNILLAKNIVAQNINLTTENLTIAGKKLSDYIDERVNQILASRQLFSASEKIISPVVETEEIQFKNQNAKIKMQNDNAKLKIVDNKDQTIAEFKTDEKETSLFGLRS